MQSGGATPVTNGVTTPSAGCAKSPPPDQRTKICVYCGSSSGSNPAHMETARELARVMAAKDIALGRSIAAG